jgi:hypothetical protein
MNALIGRAGGDARRSCNHSRGGERIAKQWPARVLALAAALLLGLAIRPAVAGPVTTWTFSFLSCDFQSGCPNPTQIAAFSIDEGPLAATPLPPSGAFYSDAVALPPQTVSAGSWDGVYIRSYRNVFNQTGSYFLFDGLEAANGIDYGEVVGIDAFVSGPSTNPLVWQEGFYTGLIAFTCNFGLDCPSTNGAIDSVRLRITAETSVVEAPEPASAALLAAMLAMVAGARRRR